MSDVRSAFATVSRFVFMCLVPVACWSETGRDLQDLPPDVEVVRVGEEMLRPLRRLSLQDLRVATELGGTDERAGYVFSSPPAGRLLEGGRILLADAEFAEVRLYGPDGLLAFRMGRHGQGPGEFSRIDWIAVRGQDTVVVWDPSSARLTYLSLDGDVLEVVRADPSLTAQRRMPFRGMFDDGSFPLRAREFRPIPDDPAVEEFTDTARYLLFGPNGAYRRELVRTPGEERFVYRRSGSVVMISPIFGATELATAVADRFVHAHSGTPVVWELSRTGDTVRVWDFDLRTRRATERDLRAFREGLPFDEDSTGIAARFAEAWEEAPVRTDLPYFDRIVGASDRTAWLGLYAAETEQERVWVGLEPEGSLGPVISLPREYELLDTRDGRILVVFEDSLGRPTVRAFRGGFPGAGTR